MSLQFVQSSFPDLHHDFLLIDIFNALNVFWTMINLMTNMPMYILVHTWWFKTSKEASIRGLWNNIPLVWSCILMGYFIHHWRCCGAFISIHLGEALLSLHMLWVPNCCHKINEIIELFENLVLHLCKVYFFQEPFYFSAPASQNVKSNDLGQIILKYFRAIFYTMICLPQCLEGFPQSHLVWINASSLS